MSLAAEDKLLPIVEEFYSIQGEGLNTGKASYFLRIGGCDVCCNWCDEKEAWNGKQYPLVHVDEIVKRVLKNPSKSLIVTGGEPLKHNLNYLCKELKKNNISTYLETSGAYPISGIWDWICLSPKKGKPPHKEIYSMASELKVVIQTVEDIEWAECNARLVDKNCLLFLQPEWMLRHTINKKIIDYILNNPKWMLSIQTHKHLKIL